MLIKLQMYCVQGRFLCIQPEEEIIKAMKNVDIRIDSSVFKDGKSSEAYLHTIMSKHRIRLAIGGQILKMFVK